MSGQSTIAIHADRDVHPSRAVARPIYQTAAFWAEDAEQFAHAAVDRRGHDFYTRYGNPNHAQVAAVVAELEQTEAAMVTASGMAALTTAVLGLVSAGDHVIGQKSTYGGTASVLLNLLPRLGVSITQMDQTDPTAFEKALTPQTRLILVESPSNPLLQITDLRAVAELARAHGVLTMADNTFATPLNQRPAEYGIDLVWHSATKYLNGHSDVSAGVLAASAELLDRIWEVALLTGATLGPFDAWLLLRGLRTLPLRIPRHNANGQAIAEALQDWSGWPPARKTRPTWWPTYSPRPTRWPPDESPSGVGQFEAFRGGALLMKTLITGGIVVSVDAAVGDFQRGDVLIEDGVIVNVAERIEAPDADVIDATDRIVMPGFVDSHRHTWQTAFRGVGADWLSTTMWSRCMTR